MFKHEWPIKSITGEMTGKKRTFTLRTGNCRTELQVWEVNKDGSLGDMILSFYENTKEGDLHVTEYAPRIKA